MADLDRVKRNVQRMITMDAPEADIDEYISSEGTTLDAVRGHKVGSGAAEAAHSKAQFFDNSEQQARAEDADLRVAKERSEQTPAWTKTRDVLRNVASGGTVLGVPLGSWSDEANSALSDVTHRLTGGRYGEPYQDRMDYQAASDRAADADSVKLGSLPVVGEVTGGGLTKLASGVASSLAAPQSLARMFVERPFQTGALAGGIYGGGEGQGWDRARNASIGAAWGGALGKAAPWTGRRVANTYNYVADKVRKRPPALAGYQPQAVDNVLSGVEESRLFNGANPENYAAQRARLGPEGMLGDMSDNLRGQTYAVGTTPGEAQTVVRRALQPRKDTSADRLESTFNREMGAPRNLVQEQERILGQANQDAAPYYDRFYNKQIAVTPSLQSVLERIGAARSGQSSIMALAERKAAMEGFAGGGQLTGRHIDYIKRALDDVAWDKATPRDDARIFKKMIADLKAAVPDQDWRIARDMAGSGQQFREGVEMGGDVLKKGYDPDQLARDMRGMPYVKQNGLFEGARGYVRDQMQEAGTKYGSSGDTKAMQMFTTPASQKRLEALMNPRSARNITNRVKAEQQMAGTHDAVYGNSRTDARGAARKMYPNPADRTDADLPLSVEHAVGKMMRRVIAVTRNEALNAKAARVAVDAARMLVAQGAQRDLIAASLRQLSRSKGTSAQAARRLGHAAEVLLRTSSYRATDASRRRIAPKRSR